MGREREYPDNIKNLLVWYLNSSVEKLWQISIRKAESPWELWYKGFIKEIRYYTTVGEAREESKRGKWRIRVKSLTSPSEALCRWTLRPGSGKQDLSSSVELQRRAGRGIYGRLLPLHPVEGPESLFASRVSSRTRASCRTGTATRWDLQEP